MGNSKRGESTEIAASFENASERNNTFHELNTNDEIRKNIPDEWVNCWFQEHILTGNYKFITLVFGVPR